ncbi:hypothetical protein [Streptomyces sp. NPDC059651]
MPDSPSQDEQAPAESTAPDPDEPPHPVPQDPPAPDEALDDGWVDA